MGMNSLIVVVFLMLTGFSPSLYVTQDVFIQNLCTLNGTEHIIPSFYQLKIMVVPAVNNFLLMNLATGEYGK